MHVVCKQPPALEYLGGEYSRQRICNVGVQDRERKLSDLVRKYSAHVSRVGGGRPAHA